MTAENNKRQADDQSKMTWAGILGGAALLLVSLGALIYFFVISK